MHRQTTDDLKLVTANLKRGLGRHDIYSTRPLQKKKIGWPDAKEDEHEKKNESDKSAKTYKKQKSRKDPRYQ